MGRPIAGHRHSASGGNGFRRAGNARFRVHGQSCACRALVPVARRSGCGQARTGVRELILAGGASRPSDNAVVGDTAVEFIARYKVDYAVISASALDPYGAVLDFDAREVSVARAILCNARTRILVCDSSKFERMAPIRICDADDLPPCALREAAQLGKAEILTADQGNYRVGKRS